MKTMLKCVVVDDEPLALEVLQGYLERLPETHSIALFGQATEALSYLRNHQADVLFLDIEMPGMTGIEFLRALPDPPLTVFSTAYRNYAFEGYEMGVIDFLLKPVSYYRFEQAIKKIREFLALKDQHVHIENIHPGGSADFVFVKSGTKRVKLQFDDVTHIQGLKDYAIIHTYSEKILLKGSIKAMLEIFPKNRFIRVHKSFIIAIHKIKRLEKNSIALHDHRIPIGRSFKDDLETALNLH